MMADRWKTFQSKYGFSFFLMGQVSINAAFLLQQLHFFSPPNIISNYPDCPSELPNIINQSANSLSH